MTDKQIIDIYAKSKNKRSAIKFINNEKIDMKYLNKVLKRNNIVHRWQLLSDGTMRNITTGEVRSWEDAKGSAIVKAIIKFKRINK
ncbi:MAG: hypothetical protein ACRC1T_11890 [Clostridium chrysemydis]|uniref:hypothetical protein n=1 Tax=Clostridium chrysemydis TaxID=2665504 RepID=UPI003F2FCCC8